MKHAPLTGLARPLVWSYPSNRAIVGLGAGFAAGRLVARRDVGWPTAGVFASWALLRELAPDSELVAPLAAAAVAPSLWRADRATARERAVAIGLTMLAARVATRSTGLAPTPLDYVALAVAAVALPRRASGRVAAALLGAALIYERITR